jgi:hypothetical protein
VPAFVLPTRFLHRTLKDFGPLAATILQRVRLLLLTIVVGVLVGVSGQVTDDGPLLVRLANAIAVGWLLAAFTVGALAGSGVRAALGGAGTIVVGVVTYYGLFHEHSAKLLVVVGAWCAFGIGVGAVIGWAGDAWRRRRAQAVGVALLAGALAGEAILLFGEWSGRARTILPFELVLGAALPYLLARPKLAQTVALTAAVAVAVTAVEPGIRDTMRVAGWRGR